MDDSVANNWEIHARVISKSKIKEYKGGKLFKLDLQDDEHVKQGGSFQIECTCFKETIDRFFPLLEEGKTYSISGASVYKANRKFT